MRSPKYAIPAGAARTEGSAKNTSVWAVADSTGVSIGSLAGVPQEVIHSIAAKRDNSSSRFISGVSPFSDRLALPHLRLGKYPFQTHHLHNGCGLHIFIMPYVCRFVKKKIKKYKNCVNGRRDCIISANAKNLRKKPEADSI